MSQSELPSVLAPDLDWAPALLFTCGPGSLSISRQHRGPPGPSPAQEYNLKTIECCKNRKPQVFMILWYFEKVS